MSENPSEPTGIIIHGFNKPRFNNCIGKLLTLVEVLGLEQEREQAFKSLVRQEIWNLFEHPMYIEEKKIGDEKGLFRGMTEDHFLI